MAQADRAVLGRHVSLAELGVYNIAFFMASVPTLLAQAMVGRIIFPLYARRAPADSSENRRKINKE